MQITLPSCDLIGQTCHFYAYLFQGNYVICKSPDEYTIQCDTSRGMKDFQFDQIFMPESTQERVFEDTNVSHSYLELHH